MLLAGTFYIESLMAFMNRYFLICILITSSCASLDYEEIYSISRNAIFGVDDIVINQDLINRTRYSFIKVKIGKSRVAIMPLSEISNNVYKWVGSDSTIYTLNGKIIKTIGLDHDIDLISMEPEQTLILLQHPNAMITQSISYKTMELSNSLNSKYEEIREVFNTIDFKWRGENIYIRDKKSGLYYKSTQSIHPRLDKVSLDFVYIY